MIIAALNARFADEEARGELPEGANPGGFRLLHGCELEVRADGNLDYEDDLLARFDLVVASVHVARRQPRAELTRRTLNAIRSPHVDVIAHPSGRMIQTRDDLDLDWDAVFEAAAATGTALEMNGSPHRLDLAAERARRAHEMGCVLSIDSDAHGPRSSSTSAGASTRRAGRGSSRGTCSTRCRSTSCSSGSRASPRACEPGRTIRRRCFPGMSPRRRRSSRAASSSSWRSSSSRSRGWWSRPTRSSSPGSCPSSMLLAGIGGPRLGAQPAAVRASPRPGGPDRRRGRGDPPRPARPAA